MKPTALLTNAIDNVATVVKAITENEKVLYLFNDNLQEVKTNEKIPIYHKIALIDIQSGADIIKYGEEIGRATCNIAKGDWVHIHNVESKRGRGDLK